MVGDQHGARALRGHHERRARDPPESGLGARSSVSGAIKGRQSEFRSGVKASRRRRRRGAGHLADFVGLIKRRKEQEDDCRIRKVISVGLRAGIGLAPAQDPSES